MKSNEDCYFKIQMTLTWLTNSVASGDWCVPFQLFCKHCVCARGICWNGKKLFRSVLLLGSLLHAPLFTRNLFRWRFTPSLMVFSFVWNLGKMYLLGNVLTVKLIITKFLLFCSGLWKLLYIAGRSLIFSTWCWLV